jgi:hypothetical protein
MCLCSWTTAETELRQKHKTRRIGRRASAFSHGTIILERERKGRLLLRVTISPTSTKVETQSLVISYFTISSKTRQLESVSRNRSPGKEVGKELKQIRAWAM